MDWIQEMYHWHPVLTGMIGMAICNCAITTLPTPEPNGSKFYAWLFNFSHALVLAIPRIVSQYKDSPNQPK